MISTYTHNECICLFLTNKVLFLFLQTIYLAIFFLKFYQYILSIFLHQLSKIFYTLFFFYDYGENHLLFSFSHKKLHFSFIFISLYFFFHPLISFIFLHLFFCFFSIYSSAAFKFKINMNTEILQLKKKISKEQLTELYLCKCNKTQDLPLVKQILNCDHLSFQLQHSKKRKTTDLFSLFFLSRVLESVLTHTKLC